MSIYYKYCKKYAIPFIVGTICVAFEAVCDLLNPTLMSKIINTGIETGSIKSTIYWGALMLGTTLTGACFAISRNLLASYVSQSVGADLRLDIFKRILNFSEESVDKIETGSLITRMTNDTSQITQFVNGTMRVLLKAPITCVGSIILATMLNPRLSIAIYGVVFIVGGLICLSMKLSYPRYAKLQRSMDKVNSVVLEYLIGIRLVKAFGTYSEEKEKFSNANTDLMHKGISSQIIITFISPLLTLTVGIGTVILIYIGNLLFSINLANVGDISAFTIYMTQILNSLLVITNIFNTFVRTKASTARLKEIYECPQDFIAGVSHNINGDIEFKNVSFAYPNGSGVHVIKNLSFKIEKEENLAIIGSTGCGKSTIAWLLLRFYDTNNGDILLSGANIKDLSIDTVRNSISIVPQKAIIFSDTASDNIKWGNIDATDEEVLNCINSAEAQFILNMHNGTESYIESSGVNLSGGQKQRLSIARGILKNSSILILDDATSALDSITESNVRHNLLHLVPKRTIITITQRCTTAMFADKILVLENGEMVGFGSHKELMVDCELYKDIYKSQIEGIKEEGI